MKNISSVILRQWMFYSITILAIIVSIVFQNCGKVKFSTQRMAVVPQSCGTITMTPSSALYAPTPVTFEVVTQAGISITDIDWKFTKGNTTVYTSTANPVSHTFNGTGEGPGEYIATVSFVKSDGFECELTKSFQILDNDLCRDPTGISGPSIGYVGEETSPFSVNKEPCFQGVVIWDMESDGITEHTLDAGEEVTHIYTAPGVYTIRGTVVNNEDHSQTILTHTIEIREYRCDNGATNPPSCHDCPTGFVMENGQCVGPKDCTLNGVTVPHGQSRSFYDNTNVGCGDGQPRTCSALVRECQNGVLSGDSRFSAIQCLSVNCPRPVSDCKLDGVTVRHGESRTFYKSSSVACGANCQGQSRSCSNGVLSGDSTYNKASCSVQTCPREFEAASCGFGLKSSNWYPRPPNVTSQYGECEWVGDLFMGSSRQVDATFYIGDYIDNVNGTYVARLNNPSQWEITATPGCNFNQVRDPRDHYKLMPNYCKTEYRSYAGTPLVWNVTITAKNKVTGEIKVVPLKATFKPRLLDGNNNSGGSSSSSGSSGSTGGGGGGGSGGGGTYQPPQQQK